MLKCSWIQHVDKDAQIYLIILSVRPTCCQLWLRRSCTCFSALRLCTCEFLSQMPPFPLLPSIPDIAQYVPRAQRHHPQCSHSCSAAEMSRTTPTSDFPLPLVFTVIYFTHQFPDPPTWQICPATHTCLLQTHKSGDFNKPKLLDVFAIIFSALCPTGSGFTCRYKMTYHSLSVIFPSTRPEVDLKLCNLHVSFLWTLPLTVWSFLSACRLCSLPCSWWGQQLWISCRCL